MLPERVWETIQNEANQQRGGFLSMLLGTLAASLLGNILTGKGIKSAGEEILRAGYGNKRGQKQEQKDKIMKRKWIFNAAPSFN